MKNFLEYYYENISNSTAPEIIKTAYNRVMNFESFIDYLYKYEIEDLLKYCKVTPGIPLKPMLAQPALGIEDVMKKLDFIRK